MNMHALRLAAGAASVLAASSAFALAPNAINPLAPTANDIVVHYSGATAQLDTVSALAEDYCDLTTRDVYNNAGGNSTNNGFPNATHRTITCTLKSSAPVPAAIQGKNLYFSYQQNGGSIYGVTPVIDQVDLPMMKVFGGTCAGGPSPATNWTCQNGNNAASPLTATSDQYLSKPVAGGSDVEPAMFKGSNIAGLAFGAPVGTSYVAAQAYNVVFGIAVSCALLDHTIYTSCSGPSGPIKSLSKGSIASIFQHATKDHWEAVPEFGLNKDSDGPGGFSNDLEAFLSGGIAGTQIHVCRRKPGSGTQAGVQAYFLNQECGSPSRLFVTNAGDGARVEEISSSSSILTSCMNTQPAAIGISSLEKAPGATYGTNWAYVNIDGITPTLDNAAFGYYDYMFENSMQYNSAVISANQLTFINAMFTAAQNPATLVGLPGVLAIPVGSNTPLDFADSNGNGVLAEYASTNPVASVTRGGNACRPEAAVY
jgi:hypothetical protein